MKALITLRIARGHFTNGVLRLSVYPRQLILRHFPSMSDFVGYPQTTLQCAAQQDEISSTPQRGTRHATVAIFVCIGRKMWSVEKTVLFES